MKIFIDGREKIGIENLKNPKAFTDYSQTIDDIYKNLEDYDPSKKRRVLIVLDDMIADMESNKKLSPIVTELFLRGKKNSISLIFISQSNFKVPKTMRLNMTHSFIIKVPNKREFLKIASNHSSDIDFKDFMKLYKEYNKEPHSYLKNNMTLPSNNPLPFRKNVL